MPDLGTCVLLPSQSVGKNLLSPDHAYFFFNDPVLREIPFPKCAQRVRVNSPRAWSERLFKGSLLSCLRVLSQQQLVTKTNTFLPKWPSPVAKGTTLLQCIPFQACESIKTNLAKLLCAGFKNSVTFELCKKKNSSCLFSWWGIVQVSLAVQDIHQLVSTSAPAQKSLQWLLLHFCAWFLAKGFA